MPVAAGASPTRSRPRRLATARPRGERLLVFLGIVFALLNGCTGSSGAGRANITVDTPEGRVAARIDPHSGAIQVVTPKGMMTGHMSPGGGGFRLAGPDGTVRLDASPYGAHLRAAGRDGMVQVNAGQRGAQVRVASAQGNANVQVQAPRYPVVVHPPPVPYYPYGKPGPGSPQSAQTYTQTAAVQSTTLGSPALQNVAAAPIGSQSTVQPAVALSPDSVSGGTVYPYVKPPSADQQQLGTMLAAFSETPDFGNFNMTR